MSTSPAKQCRGPNTEAHTIKLIKTNYPPSPLEVPGKVAETVPTPSNLQLASAIIAPWAAGCPAAGHRGAAVLGVP